MRYNNINLFHFVFVITSISEHFYLHSNAKLLILQTGDSCTALPKLHFTNMILKNKNLFFIIF